MTPLELQGYSCVLEVCLLTAHPSQAGFLLQKRGLNFILLSITRILSKQVLFSSTLFSATAWKESINLQIISTAAHHPISMCLPISGANSLCSGEVFKPESNQPGFTVQNGSFNDIKCRVFCIRKSKGAAMPRRTRKRVKGPAVGKTFLPYGLCVAGSG